MVYDGGTVSQTIANKCFNATTGFTKSSLISQKGANPYAFSWNFFIIKQEKRGEKKKDV